MKKMWDSSCLVFKDKKSQYAEVNCDHLNSRIRADNMKMRDRMEQAVIAAADHKRGKH